MRFWKRTAAWGGLGAALLAAGGLAQAQSLREAADARDRYLGAAVAMSPLRNEAAYRDTLAREFNMLVAENAFKMDALRPSRTTFNFTDADALMQFAEANRMAVRGHTLVWHSQLPGWLTGGTFTRDEVIAIMREHIQTVVGRYRGRILAWDVVNEAIDDGNGQLRTGSFWHQRIGPDYVRLAFEFARDADPTAVLYYNDYSAEGLGTKSDGVYNLVRNLRDQGVPVHGVGWQMHQINPFRIQAAHRTNLRRLADLGLEISITEMDVRIPLPSDAAELQQQALGYGDTMQLCLEEPSCKAVVAWGFTDKYSWIPGFFQGFGDALIFNPSYQPKPARAALLQALTGTAQPPPTPTGLTATAGDGQVQLGWNASAGAAGYSVKRSTASGGPYSTVGSPSGTSFTSTGLTNGTLYFFVVSAVNAAGESPNSGEASARPQAPAGFTLSATPGSASIAPGACATFTITINRSGGFTGPVAPSVGGLPAGWTATISPNPVTGNTATITICAPGTAPAGPVTLTITATGGGLTRTTSVSLTVTGGDTGTGGVTATPVVTTSGAWFNEEVVRLSNTAPLTALSVTIVIQRTPGVGFSGQYNTVGGQIQQGSSSTAAAVTYQFNLAPGQTLGPGSNRTFAAQTGGQGTVHPTGGDTFTVTYTTGGVTYTQTGHY